MWSELEPTPHTSRWLVTTARDNIFLELLRLTFIRSETRELSYLFPSRKLFCDLSISKRNIPNLSFLNPYFDSGEWLLLILPLGRFFVLTTVRFPFKSQVMIGSVLIKDFSCFRQCSAGFL